jgi:hypothetical protein
MEHLRFPFWAAFAAALAIEGMGFFTTANMLMLYEYNQNRRKTYPAAPVWIAVFTVLAYVSVVVLLAVVLDDEPANAIFPLLSLTAMTTAALRYQHKARLLGIEQEKADRKASRPASKASSEQAPSQPVGFICEQCQRPFASVQALNAHMRAHISKNGKAGASLPGESVSVETDAEPVDEVSLFERTLPY